MLYQETECRIEIPKIGGGETEKGQIRVVGFTPFGSDTF